MNASIYFLPGLIVSGVRRTYDCVVVEFEGYDTYTFTYRARTAYTYATRFLRLVELGYAPFRALVLATQVGEAPTLLTYERNFDTSAHTEFPVPFIPEGFASSEDVMFKDELTPAEIERLYAMWLQDGDEIFHFESDYFDDINIPELLSSFRALAQGQDDITGDWTHSHHSDMVQY